MNQKFVLNLIILLSSYDDEPSSCWAWNQQEVAAVASYTVLLLSQGHIVAHERLRPAQA